MKWATCLTDGVVTIVDGPPPVIGPGEILVQMRACGICGTDVGKIYTPGYPRPTKLGHEVVGTVVEVGAGVEHFQVGQRVALAHHVPNYGSHYSWHGNESMDPQFKRTNIDPGGMAEFIRVPALHVKYTVLPVPDSIPDLRAIFMEPLACCLRALDRVPIREGDTALIFGVGAIGMLFLPLLGDRSIHTLATDLRKERLEAACRLDPRLVALTVNQDLAMITHSQTEGRGADLAILTAVNATIFKTALAVVRDGGTILLFGGKADVTLSFDAWNLLAREINIITSYSSTPSTLHRALAILERDDYAFEQIVNPVLKLDQTAQGFDLAYRAQGSKVAIIP